jgi:prephenate dehydrogenase
MTQSADRATPEFSTVAIAGVGLIGGSLAAALKIRKLVRTVVGVGRDSSRLAEAKSRGLIDDATTDLAGAAAVADLLVFCTPVDRIVAGVRAAAAGCRPGTLITDAGSVKGTICRCLAEGLPAGVEFVGSHPLAGSERQGFEHADADLFANRVCVLTPTETTSRRAGERIRRLWEAIGSSVVEMSPEAHDRAVAETSHLPHVIAAALAAVLAPENAALAATGFRDTTRIASGDPELWRAILLNNADGVLDGLRKYEESLASFRNALEDRNGPRLKELLAEARSRRNSLELNSLELNSLEPKSLETGRSQVLPE